MVVGTANRSPIINPEPLRESLGTAFPPLHEPCHDAHPPLRPIHPPHVPPALERVVARLPHGPARGLLLLLGVGEKELRGPLLVPIAIDAG